MAGLLILVGAVVGALLGGAGGFFLGALIGAFLGYALTASKKKKDRNRSQPAPPIINAPIPQLSVSASRGGYQSRKKEPMRWIQEGHQIEIAGYQISAGMIYVADGEPETFESSAINNRLPVAPPADDQLAPLGYYTQYSYLAPVQRGAYLQWLANGRKDENPSGRDIGYILLFFYGIERHLLIDGGDGQEPVAELVRLLKHYAVHPRARSLQGRVCQFIHFWGWKQGLQYYSKLWDWMGSLPVSLLGRDELGVVLGSYQLRGAPLPAATAFRVLSMLPEARSSVVLKRSPEEFQSLFMKRYVEKFPNGIVLAATSTPTTIRYRVSNPSIYPLGYNSPDFCVTFPNVLGVPRQFGPLITIWDSCIDDLSRYTRVKSKGDAGAVKLKQYLQLPPELKAETSHPLSSTWCELLETARAAEGCVLLAGGEIASMLSIQKREKLTLSQSRELAQAVESLGYAIEPDTRFDDTTYGWEQIVGVYPLNGQSSLPSLQYNGIAALLSLCVLIAAADGNIDDQELQVFHRFVENHAKPSATDIERLRTLEQVLCHDLSKATSSLARIAKRLPADKRESVGEFLVFVAAADGIVTKDELRALERIFKAIELPADKLRVLLDRIVQERGEITIEQAGPRVAGERIPTSASTAFVQIDMSRVAQISQETTEVISILSKVLADDDAEPQTKTVLSPPIAIERNKNRNGTTTQTASWALSLEDKYRGLLFKLLERESWKRTEFEALARENKLMALGVYDAINEWSDAELGDFLLEGEDPILVHKELVPEQNPTHG